MPTSSLLLHATWNGSFIHFWIEETDAERTVLPPRKRSDIWRHPRALRDGPLDAACSLIHKGTVRAYHIDMQLPSDARGPLPSTAPVPADATLQLWRVPALLVAPGRAAQILAGLPEGLPVAPDVKAWSEVSRYVLGLVARGQVVPAVRLGGGTAEASWDAAPPDVHELAWLRALAEAMPLAACPQGDRFDAVMAFARAAVTRNIRADAAAQRAHAPLEENWPLAPARWLAALREGLPTVSASPRQLERLQADVAAWTAAAREGPQPSLCLRLQAPHDDGRWPLEVMLALPTDAPLLPLSETHRAEGPWALFVGSLRARADALVEAACAVYPRLARAGAMLLLDDEEAARFLMHDARALQEIGVQVLIPAGVPTDPTRFEASLQIGPSQLGRDALLDFHWDARADGEPIDVDAILAAIQTRKRLVRVGNRWVLLDRTQAARLAAMLSGSKQGRIGDAMRMACAQDDVVIHLEIPHDLARRQDFSPPPTFHGQLRPYQTRGVAWMLGLRELGLGACLADDMGLGKTVQVIALLAHDGVGAGPVLLVCPTSVVGNWRRELERFAPALRVHVHHGGGRRSEGSFDDADVVITTYALTARDAALLQEARWRGVIIDEAQNVKNPRSAQSRAVRALQASDFRIALTGTPVENSLTDLWPIMEFLNPGMLGTQDGFQRRFVLPIGRGDQARLGRLRAAIGPVLLRRSKTDRSIIADLPEKIESRQFCALTAEQAMLYRAVACEMLEKADAVDGMERRSSILSAIVRLKQICNHPRSLPGADGALEGRSGKLTRLEELLDAVVSAGDRALVFTQFAEWGERLVTHLRQRLGCPVLWLHGGTPRAQRDEMVAGFNTGTGAAVFVLSLRAGGTGLNLVGATHVIHYDRWWNPAVENQATDRAYRIGQSRNVQVHKMLCGGTLEERIDELIERKISLADDILGERDGWLTELSTADLRKVVELSDALVEEAN